MGFPRQEYWGVLPFPSPEDPPDPGIEPKSLTSPALQDSLPSELARKPLVALAVKNLPASAEDSGSVFGLGEFHMPWGN